MSDWSTSAYRAFAMPVESAIGAQAAKKFASWNISTVGDLLKHLPRRYLSGTELSDIGTVRDGEEVALMAKVVDVSVHGYHPRMRLEATITDGRGKLRLTFFGRKHLVDWWATQLECGDRGLFVGKVSFFRNAPQMTHPDFVMLDEQGAVVGRADKKNLVTAVTTDGFVGLYPAKSGLPTWSVADCLTLALAAVEPLEDPLPTWVRERCGLVGLSEALRGAHRPRNRLEIEPARDRLTFDEAFAVALTMVRRRGLAREAAAVPRPRTEGGLLAAFDARLPFELTRGQREVGEEIFEDLVRPHPMQRLLQGEVGSGKTLVALRAMLTVIDAGGQAVLLAPTEVLANQHALTFERMLGDLVAGGTLGAPAEATRLTLLSGSLGAAQRRAALFDIASGAAGIVVGTHALLGREVAFAELALVVVDEQHRFGVEQRAALASKSDAKPHVLVMTATPIPRTVAMTLFGDLDTSVLTEVPAGRSDVHTTVVDTVAKPAWVERAWQRVREEVEQGRQAFIVAPRIDADADGGAAVEELFSSLSGGALASLRVGKLHGKMPSADKTAVMAAFAGGELDVLVATTVIEVGVDVPNASMMVICDAERFGISQLHQLRGRIGRGAHAGICLLLTSAEPGSTTRDRLDAVAATRDGFALAEVDLEQRKEGNILGSAQSGFPSKLRLLRVTEHATMIEQAHSAALEALARDPELNEPGLADAVLWIEQLAQDEAWEG